MSLLWLWNIDFASIFEKLSVENLAKRQWPKQTNQGRRNGRVGGGGSVAMLPLNSLYSICKNWTLSLFRGFRMSGHPTFELVPTAQQKIMNVWYTICILSYRYLQPVHAERNTILSYIKSKFRVRVIWFSVTVGLQTCSWRVGVWFLWQRGFHSGQPEVIPNSPSSPKFYCGEATRVWKIN